jgi:hypothetical protein
MKATQPISLTQLTWSPADITSEPIVSALPPLNRYLHRCQHLLKFSHRKWHYGSSTTSTRRFFARPPSVRLSETGAAAPTPTASSRAAETEYCDVSSWTTASARRRERSMFARKGSGRRVFVEPFSIRAVRWMPKFRIYPRAQSPLPACPCPRERSCPTALCSHRDRSCPTALSSPTEQRSRYRN